MIGAPKTRLLEQSTNLKTVILFRQGSDVGDIIYISGWNIASLDNRNPACRFCKRKCNICPARQSPPQTTLVLRSHRRFAIFSLCMWCRVQFCIRLVCSSYASECGCCGNQIIKLLSDYNFNVNFNTFIIIKLIHEIGQWQIIRANCENKVCPKMDFNALGFSTAGSHLKAGYSKMILTHRDRHFCEIWYKKMRNTS